MKEDGYTENYCILPKKPGMDLPLQILRKEAIFWL
jgi:hypothetical protein